jgi:S-adenosylmethionine synthetase
MVIIAGEITTDAWVDTEEVVRGVVKEIGYNSSEIGFDYESCAVQAENPELHQKSDRQLYRDALPRLTRK